MTTTVTGVQLALDCEPDWPAPDQPARREHRDPFEQYDLRTQGLTREQILDITDVPLEGDYL
jgi:hypothetical protein